MSIATTDVIA